MISVSTRNKIVQNSTSVVSITGTTTEDTISLTITPESINTGSVSFFSFEVPIDVGLNVISLTSISDVDSMTEIITIIRLEEDLQITGISAINISPLYVGLYSIVDILKTIEIYDTIGS